MIPLVGAILSYEHSMYALSLSVFHLLRVCPTHHTVKAGVLNLSNRALHV